MRLIASLLLLAASYAFCTTKPLKATDISFLSYSSITDEKEQSQWLQITLWVENPEDVSEFTIGSVVEEQSVLLRRYRVEKINHQWYLVRPGVKRLFEKGKLVLKVPTNTKLDSKKSIWANYVNSRNKTRNLKL